MKADLTLYRLFSADNELLYVGMTGGPMLRIFHHSSYMPWWGEVVTIRLERGFISREELAAAEREAIRVEQPRYNVAGIRPIPQRRPQDILNEEAVRAIRSSTEKTHVLAEQFGVTRQTIYQVRARKTWRHVE